MKILTWIMRFALSIIALTFSIRNTDLITVQWLPGLEVEVPLVVALLVALLLGAILAWVSLLPSWLKAKRVASVSTKNAEHLKQALDQAKTANNQTVQIKETPITTPVGLNHGI